jgi:hypothetical protein
MLSAEDMQGYDTCIPFGAAVKLRGAWFPLKCLQFGNSAGQEISFCQGSRRFVAMFTIDANWDYPESD